MRIPVVQLLTDLGRTFANPKTKEVLVLETFTTSTKALSCSLLGILLTTITPFSRRF